MATLKLISPRRAGIRAWRVLAGYLAMISFSCAMAVLGWALDALHDGASLGRFPLSPLTVAAVVASCPIAGLLLAAAWRYHKARWPRGLGCIVPTRRRVPIASAPRDGATAVTLEGVVAPSAQGAGLTAPVSGVACVYYRVRIEWWNPPPWPGLLRPDWWVLEDRAKLHAFVVADDSGFVRIEPLLDRAKLSIPEHEPVDFDLDSARRITVHESTTGVDGLPPSARAFIEAELAERAQSERRLRVSEVCLCPGDVVSLFGRIHDRVEEAGAFRGQGAEHVGVMSGFQKELRVVPASLAELRWLRRFDLGILSLLLLCAVLAALAFVLGFARMDGARSRASATTQTALVRDA